VQGVGQSGLRILSGAAALISIDARPLVLAFAICGGAAIYFSMPAESQMAHVAWAIAAAFAGWLIARQW